MTILGVDPGIARLGWAIVEVQRSKVESRSFGCIETSSKMSREKRLQKIFLELSRIIKKYRPEALSIEELFFGDNSKTAFVVGEARGIVLLTAAQSGLEIGFYTPLQVKLALTGFGGAQKPQIAQMVKTILKLDKIPKMDDTTDALAIALTHAFSMKMRKLQL